MMIVEVPQAQHIYKRSGTTWSEQAKLIAFDGAAYLFMRNGTSWSLQAKLTASDGAANDLFGWSVSISGDYAVVGAPFDDDDGTSSGSAYVYVRSDTTWSEQAKLLPSVGAEFDFYGSSVSISGDYIVVGSHQNDDKGDKAGSANVYMRSGSSWPEQAKLLAADGAAGDFFGKAVSITGDLVSVGAWSDDDNGPSSGSIYIFMRDGTNWSQSEKISAFDGSTGDAFGRYIASDSSYIVVGARRDDDNGTDAGSAYILNLFNTAPVITSADSVTAFEDVAFSYTVTATNLERDTLSYTFSNLSSWLSDSGATVSGTPTEGITAGAFSVIVSDDSLSDTLDVTVTVVAVNDPPVLSDLPDVVFNEDESVVVRFSDWFGLVVDPDNADNTLEWSLESGAGDSVFIMIDGDSVIFEAPQDWFAFNRDTLKVRVSDGSLTDSTRLAVHVMPVNDAPMFVDFPDSVEIVLGEADTLILSEFGFDIDDPDSLLTFAQFVCTDTEGELCVNTKADSAFINPDGQYSGISNFDFVVTDTSGYSDTVTIVIYIKNVVGVVNEGLIPQVYSLSDNYPNPFNPQTTISYGLPKQSDLSLIIYSLMGQEIMRWDEQNSLPGLYQKIWNGRNKFGVSVGSGVYFYRIIAGDFTQTKKMVLLK